MFTGIVQACTAIKHFEKKTGLISFSIELSDKLAEGLNLGASIAINGICLTVTAFEQADGGRTAVVHFDMMQQTLDLTNANSFAVNTLVNVERSATALQEIGGHIVSGHVDTQAEILQITHTENNRRLRFSFAGKYGKYLFDKGFVGLNGCSLTIACVNHNEDWIEVCFIPETLRATTFGRLQEGDKVNLEVDRQTQAIVDTVERVLALKNGHRTKVST